MKTPLPFPDWLGALEALGRAHLEHGYLPRHVVVRVAADIGRSPETFERRYWRDLRVRGLRQTPRLDESTLELIADARDLPVAHRRLAKTDRALEYRVFEHAVMSTPGLCLARLLRQEESRRGALEKIATCPICHPAHERAA